MATHDKARRHEQAIAALLEQSSLALAAQHAGISERTLRNWLADPAFQSAYATERRRILERTVARLLANTGKAIDALVDNLTCGESPAENRAAIAILDHTYRGVEALDLVRQMEEFRSELEAMKKCPPQPSAEN